jgi:hypothetical protein
MKRIYTKLFILFLLFSSVKAYSQTGLKINEIDYDQVLQDSAEFIELYNSSANAIDLGNYSIVLINGNGSTPYDTIALPAQSLNPSSYFVICGGFNVVPLCDMVLTLTSNIIQNGSPDGVAIVENGSGNVIDAVSYEGTLNAPWFETAGFPAGPTTSDSGVVNFVGISRFPDGADINDNSQDFHLVCITPGMPNVQDTSACQQPNSVPQVQGKTNLNIFPNPSKGIAFVDLNGMQLNNASLIIFNVLGKEIKTMSLKNSEAFHQMDLSDLQDGIYYVKLKTGHGEKTQRIILRK